MIHRFKIETYLDDTKAITSKGQVVDCVTKTTITKVKGLLAVERWTRISIRYSLGHGSC